LQKEFTGRNVPPGLGHQSTLNFIKNEPYLVLRGMYDGTEKEGAQAIQSLLGTDGCQDVDWRRGTYLDLNGNLNGNPMVPDVVIGYTRTQADSRYVERQLTIDEWATLASHFQQSPNLGNFIGLEAYGGAIGRYGPSETAFLHRRASFDVYTWVFWLNCEQRQESLKFLQGFRDVMDRIGNGHAYQNYPNRDNRNYQRMYWGENLERLQRIKEKYDPENLFCYGQSVSSSVLHGSAGPELGSAALA
jgi:FAD/FMN-containing dehydrogenase